MEFNLEEGENELMEHWSSIGHTERFEELEDNNVAVVVRGTFIKDYEDFEELDEDYNHLCQDLEDYDEYNIPISRRIRMIAWLYYKHFAFRHVTDILKKLKAQARILEGTGFLNLDLLISESEKLRDQYLAEYLDMIERNKDNFSIDLDITFRENPWISLNPEDVKLISDVKFDEDQQQIVVSTYHDSYSVELTDLKDDLKSLPDRLYKPLYKEYYTVVGILHALKKDALTRIFNCRPIIKDTKLQEYEELFNLYWKDLESLRVIPPRPSFIYKPRPNPSYFSGTWHIGKNL